MELNDLLMEKEWLSLLNWDMSNILKKFTNKEIQSPVWRILQSVYFIGVPWINDKSAKIYFEIWDASNDEIIYSSKEDYIK